jgi:hypothetical protein
MKKVIQFYFILALCAGIQDLFASTINPDHYNELASSSVSLFRVINEYKDLVKLEDSVVFMQADGFFIPQIFTLPSTEGDLNGTPSQFDAIINVKILQTENLTARFFLLGSYFYLMLDSETINTYPIFKANDIKEGWQYGNAIAAIQCNFADYDFTLGMNIRYLPYISYENTGNGEFALYQDEDMNWDTKTMTFERLYFDTEINGYKLNSLFSINDIIEQIAIEKLFHLDPFNLQVGPSLYFSNPGDLILSGARFKGSIGKILQYSGGVFPKIDLSNISLGFENAYIDIRIPVLDFQNINNPRRNFELIFNLKTSISQSVDEDYLAGYSGEIFLNHIPFWSVWNLVSRKTYIGVKGGFSYNYYDSLQRMPFSNTPLYYLQIFAQMD